MIANVLLVCFLGLAVLLWGHYGLFSAFLHLVVTITCGALAFALWEPLVLGILIHRMPSYAWGVGLLAPFILAILGMRALQDHLVRVNMRFANMASIIGGGFCGLLSGILTAGMVIIGVGMLPIGEAVIDYSPISMRPNGSLEGQAGAGLLLPVDRWTGRFFSSLSLGAFAPTGRTALGSHRPDVEAMAILNRQHPDPHASIVAQPDSVKANGLARFTRGEVQDLLGEDPVGGTDDLLLISTEWHASQGAATYDRDGGLRVAPAQVRLQTSTKGNTTDVGTMHAPMGVFVDGGKAKRFSGYHDMAYTKLKNGAEIVWAFRVGPNEKPLRFFIRLLRIELPEWDADAKSRFEKVVRPLLGRIKPAKAVEGKPPRPPARPHISESDGAIRSGGASGIAVTVSAQLPKMLSMHHVHQHKLEGQEIYDGRGEVKLPTNTSRNTRIKALYTAKDEYMVRVQVSRERAFSLFGQARQFGAGAGAIYIQDTAGHRHHPIGYAWLKEKSMEVVVDRMGSLQRVSQLPMRDMRPKDELHVYFALPRDVDPRKVVFAESEQDITGIQSPRRDD